MLDPNLRQALDTIIENLLPSERITNSQVGPEYFGSLREAAEYFSCTPKTLYLKKKKCKDFPEPNQLGTYSRKELEDWVNSRESV